MQKKLALNAHSNNFNVSNEPVHSHIMCKQQQQRQLTYSLQSTFLHTS